MPKELTSVVSSSSAVITSKTPSAEPDYCRPSDDHPVFHYIGRVAAEWSRLEHALDRIIWVLAGVISSKGACITSQQLGAAARYRVIQGQLRLRILKEPDFAEHLERVEDLMRHSYEPQEKRNRIIHDTWYADSVENAPGQFRSWPHKNPQFGIRSVDYIDIEQTIFAARSLAEKVEALYEDINRRLSHA